MPYSYVYVIYVGKGLYKIGMTNNIERRLSQLGESRLVKSIKTNDPTGLEKRLHRKFDSKRLVRDQELFKLNDEDLLIIHLWPDEWVKRQLL